MDSISAKERLENIKESDIIDAIKGLVGKSETYLSHVDETAIIADVNWLIEQAEKVEQLEKDKKFLTNIISAGIKPKEKSYSDGLDYKRN